MEKNYRKNKINERKIKTIRKRIRKTIRKTIINKRKKYKQQKGGTKTIEIIDDNDLQNRKKILVNSFILFNDVYKNILISNGYSYYLMFSTIINNVVLAIYSNPITFNYFYHFFDKLKSNKIIDCNYCTEKNITIISYNSKIYNAREYKLFKIYFIIGFIISYFFENPTKFISEEFINEKLGLNSTMLYLFKNISLNIACNGIIEIEGCDIKKAFDEFIKENNFDVSENEIITSLIFDFVKVIRYAINIDTFFDPNLQPKLVSNNE